MFYLGNVLFLSSIYIVYAYDIVALNKKCDELGQKINAVFNETDQVMSFDVDKFDNQTLALSAKLDNLGIDDLKHNDLYNQFQKSLNVFAMLLQYLSQHRLSQISSLKDEQVVLLKLKESLSYAISQVAIDVIADELIDVEKRVEDFLNQLNKKPNITIDDPDTIKDDLHTKATKLDFEVDVTVAKISGVGFLEAQAQHLRDMKATLDKLVFSLDFATNAVAVNVIKGELQEFEVKFRAELDIIDKAIKAHQPTTPGY